MHDPGSIGPTFATWRQRTVAVFLMRRAQSGKRSKKRTSPTPTTGGGGGPRRSGLHLPTTLDPAPSTMPPRLPPHERRIPH
eukprot:6193493-Prymnesium_polylepis.1